MGPAMTACSTRSSRLDTEVAGVGLAVIGAVSFGTLGIFAKFGYEAGARPFSLLATRFTIATAILLVYLVAARAPVFVGRRTMVRLLLLGGLGYGLEASLFFLALERAPVGIVSLIFYSFPLWTYLFGWMTRLEPFHGRVVFALILGTVGVASIFTVDVGGLLGPLLALAAAISVAVYLLLAQVVLRDVSPSASALWTGAGAAITVGTVALMTRQPLPLEAMGPAAALGAATAFSFVLLFAAIARIGSARAAIANMVEPITTVALAALLLDEEITLRIAVGAVLVISALPILVTTTKAPKRSSDDHAAIHAT
jgi:drug/metabolite transporter (DMT)-like permease